MERRNSQGNYVVAVFLWFWIENKRMNPNLTLAEVQVFGIGCKIFTTAGPVILYGVLASWVLGVIYWGGRVMGFF